MRRCCAVAPVGQENATSAGAVCSLPLWQRVAARAKWAKIFGIFWILKRGSPDYSYEKYWVLSDPRFSLSPPTAVREALPLTAVFFRPHFPPPFFSSDADAGQSASPRPRAREAVHRAR